MINHCWMVHHWTFLGMTVAVWYSMYFKRRKLLPWLYLTLKLLISTTDRLKKDLNKFLIFTLNVMQIILQLTKALLRIYFVLGISKTMMPLITHPVVPEDSHSFFGLHSQQSILDC